MRLLGSWHDGSRDLSRRDADTRRRDLGETAHLQFFPGLLFFQNVARLCIGNNVRLRRSRRANNGRARKKS